MLTPPEGDATHAAAFRLRCTERSNQTGDGVAPRARLMTSAFSS